MLFIRHHSLCLLSSAPKAEIVNVNPVYLFGKRCMFTLLMSNVLIMRTDVVDVLHSCGPRASQ